MNPFALTRSQSLAGYGAMMRKINIMKLPNIRSYCQYSSDNYGAHCLCVEINEVTVWFSYKTPIAFQVGCNPRVVRENDWGPTTGKHLNAIDGGDKKSRVDGQTFERLWAEQIDNRETVNA